MKKTNISKFIAVGLCICALTGCGASPDEKPDTSNPIVNSNTNEENANGSSENKGNDILDSANLIGSVLEFTDNGCLVNQAKDIEGGAGIKIEAPGMPFAEIMDDLLNSIGTEDTYSTDYVAVFEVCGEKVSIEDEQLARALKAIEERKRNIVLQYFFIGDTDTYIGKMLDCSRANVTKCRIQALDKLKQLIEEEKEKCQKS